MMSVRMTAGRCRGRVDRPRLNVHATARFDVRTGRPSMPAIEPVTVHATDVRGDDVYVAITD